MQEIFKNIGFDVASGLITSFVLFILTFFVKFWLVPLIKRIKYNGYDISGQWHCQTILGSAAYVYTFDIKQNGQDVKGRARILKTHNETIEYNQEFRLSGLIYEGYVILNLRSTNNQSLSFSTGLFQVQSRGNVLNGKLSYRVRVGDGIGSEDISFSRA